MAGLDISVDAGSYYGISFSMLDSEGLQRIEEILWEVVYSWREIMQDAWPRDTGLSFSMWRSVVRGLELVIENPVEYAEWVHPVGGSEGDSGEFLRDALDRLLSAARGAVLQATMDAEQRRSSGFAEVARQVQATQLGGGLGAAQARAFASLGGRARQRQQFPGEALGQLERRTVITRLGGALVRFRERVRQRIR